MKLLKMSLLMVGLCSLVTACESTTSQERAAVTVNAKVPSNRIAMGPTRPVPRVVMQPDDLSSDMKDVVLRIAIDHSDLDVDPALVDRLKSAASIVDVRTGRQIKLDASHVLRTPDLEPVNIEGKDQRKATVSDRRERDQLTWESARITLAPKEPLGDGWYELRMPLAVDGAYAIDSRSTTVAGDFARARFTKSPDARLKHVTFCEKARGVWKMQAKFSEDVTVQTLGEELRVARVGRPDHACDLMDPVPGEGAKLHEYECNLPASDSKEQVVLGLSLGSGLRGADGTVIKQGPRQLRQGATVELSALKDDGSGCRRLDLRPEESVAP